MLNKINNPFKAISAIITGLVLQVTFSTMVFAGEAFMINEGELQRPTGYREWVYVGTPVTPNDMNGGKAAFP